MRSEEFVRRVYFALNPTVILAQPMEIPKLLEEKIREERLLELTKLLNGEEVNEAGDAEVVAYLHSASLMVPFSDEFASIFVILTQKVLGVQVNELEYRELTEQEEYELKKLKRWLYERREKRERERAKELKEMFREIARKLPVKDRRQAEDAGGGDGMSTLEKINAKLDETLEELLDDPQTSELAKNAIVRRELHMALTKPSLAKKLVLSEL